MYYHARLDYSDVRKYWWNKPKETIILDILNPFINGQVILVDSEKGKALFNMRNAVQLRVYKTERELEHGDTDPIPRELLLSSFQDKDCTEELVKEVQTHSHLSLLHKSFSIPKKQVFVIMKFEDKHLDSAYEGVM